MKKEPYKEMNTIKEFKVLVKNTNQFISMYDHKSKSPLSINNFIIFSSIYISIYFKRILFKFCRITKNYLGSNSFSF